jgi:IS30 family transposase
MTSNHKYQQLSYDDRRTIAIGREHGLSVRAIARILNRPPSTTSREMARNQPGSNYSCHFCPTTL